MNAQVCRWLLCLLTLPATTALCQGVESARQVKLLEAIGYGQLKVTVIAQSHSKLVLVLENQQSQPLSIEPQLLAVVPAWRIRPQSGAPESSSSDELQPSTPRSPQSLATVFSEQYAKRGLRRQRGEETPGPFVVPAKAKRRLELPCFCMEYGNPDPNSRVSYRLCPLAKLKPKPATLQLLERYLNAALPQRPLQLAIWHVENEISWQKLSLLSHRGTRRAIRYSVGELREAARLSDSLTTQREMNQ